MERGATGARHRRGAVGSCGQVGGDDVERDIAAVVRETRGALVKVIIESGLFSPVDIVRACQAAQAAGAGFVKTSTGFHPSGGATTAAVWLMRRTVRDTMGVKAAGGIRDCGTAEAMFDAGATRLGSSRGPSWPSVSAEVRGHGTSWRRRPAMRAHRRSAPDDHGDLPGTHELPQSRTELARVQRARLARGVRRAEPACSSDSSSSRSIPPTWMSSTWCEWPGCAVRCAAGVVQSPPDGLTPSEQLTAIGRSVSAQICRRPALPAPPPRARVGRAWCPTGDDGRSHADGMAGGRQLLRVAGLPGPHAARRRSRASVPVHLEPVAVAGRRDSRSRSRAPTTSRASKSRRVFRGGYRSGARTISSRSSRSSAPTSARCSRGWRSWGGTRFG